MNDDADEVRLTLRLPIGVRDRLIEKGKASGRSLNAEIVTRLERTISEEDENVNIYEYVAEIERRLERIEQKVQDHDEELRPHRYLKD